MSKRVYFQMHEVLHIILKGLANDRIKINETDCGGRSRT
jgi:hypothetical protein